MSRLTAEACCKINSEVTVNGISLLEKATLGHYTEERHYAQTALSEGRAHVAKLTAHLDDLCLALAEDKNDDS